MREWLRDLALGSLIAFVIVLVVLSSVNAVEGFVYGAF